MFVAIVVYRYGKTGKFTSAGFNPFLGDSAEKTGGMAEHYLFTNRTRFQNNGYEYKVLVGELAFETVPPEEKLVEVRPFKE